VSGRMLHIVLICRLTMCVGRDSTSLHPRLNSGSFGFEEAATVRAKIRGRKGTAIKKGGLGGKYSHELPDTHEAPEKPPRRELKSMDSVSSVVSEDGWGNSSLDASHDNTLDGAGFGTSAPRSVEERNGGNSRFKRNTSTNSVTSNDGFDDADEDEGSEYLQIASTPRKLSAIAASPSPSDGFDVDDAFTFEPDAFEAALSASPPHRMATDFQVPCDHNQGRLNTRNVSVCEGFGRSLWSSSSSSSSSSFSFSWFVCDVRDFVLLVGLSSRWCHPS
jgi:hypothetical protein